MKKLLFPLFILSLFTACHNSSSEVNDKTTPRDLSLEKPAENNKSGDELNKTVVSDTTIGTSQLIPQGNSQNSDWDKKIIKTAFLKLQVKDSKSYADIVHKTAKQYGGYVANEEQNQSEEKIESTISIKVPVEQFEPIMNKLPSDAEKIIEKKITAEDVTGEVVDTKSRLQAKEQMRLKYLEFLKQSKNMEDVLKVQSEINDIQEEIESATARINYLSHQSAFSTINLTFYQPLAAYNPSNNPGFFTRSIVAFKSGVHFIGEIIIGFISIWPLLLIVFGVWFVLRTHRISITTSKQKL